MARTSRAEIEKHFKKVDPVMYRAFREVDLKDWDNAYRGRKKPEDYFEHLCRTIIGQQLSGKASKTIYERLLKLFPRGVITAEKLSKMSEAKLRSVGVSGAKARYLKDLAQKSKKGEIDYKNLPKMSEEGVIAELTQVKGLGLWSAEMFMMFALGREDIFSHGDLGLRKGMQKLYNLRSEPTLEKALKIANAWSPYRSYGSFALWHSLDNS